MADTNTGPDLSAEQGVLGCLLLGAPIPATLHEDAFSDERHKVVFDTIKLVTSEDIHADLLLTATIQRLRQREMLAGVGGEDYIRICTERAPSQYNLGYWLEQLMEIFGRRTLKENLTEFLKGLDQPGTRLDTLIGAGRKALDYLAHSRNGHNNELSSRGPRELLDMTFDDSDCIMGDRLMAKGQNFSICGPSSVGKSRLVLQQAIATITGRPFVGLETHGAGLKWLFLQAENSNRRYHFDLKHLRAWVGDKDWALVEECLRIHTLENDADSFLQLDSMVNQSKIGHLIDKWQSAFAVFDCLWNFQIGDLNKDVDMAATLMAISRLCKTGNPNRIPLVLHHALTGKAGASKATGYDRASFSRNSKVLHAWTRGQINVSAGSPTNNDTLVLSCGKCSNGREFETFAVKLNPETLIYEPDHHFDLTSWESEMSGIKRDPTMTSVRVRELCLVSGSSKMDLVNAIREDCFCSRATAYRHVDSARKSRDLTFSKASNMFFRT